jgi:hypothetical protein
MECADRESPRSAMARLIGAFEFKEHGIISLTIDRRARSRIRGHACARPKRGAEAVTETADLVTFRDGKIVPFVQFCDTALAAKLAGA